MAKPLAQRVPCIRCTRGRNGEKSCSSGWKVRSAAPGCFNGAWLLGKAPQRINGVKVQHVEAPTYMEAIKIAPAADYQQWIWVKDGVPGESHNGVE